MTAVVRFRGACLSAILAEAPGVGGRALGGEPLSRGIGCDALVLGE